MRPYKKSHDWITFQIDTSKITTKTWLLLGQAQAKCEQISGVPLLPSVVERMHLIYVAKGVHGTTAIEGNTLTEDEILEHLEGHKNIPPSMAESEQEVDNIVDACNEIARLVLSNRSIEFSIDDLKHYHKMVYKELPPEDEVIPGELRTYDVWVQGTTYKGAPPTDLIFLLNRLCKWLNFDFQPEDSKLHTIFGFLKAIVAHVYIAWIHPFGNGNGRTARLIEFRALLETGVPTAAAHLMSNYYNRTRTKYYSELMKSSQMDDGLYPFIEYSLTGFVEGLNAQIQDIEEQQLKVHWINYIHDSFRSERDTPVTTRRRRLILDMTERDETVPASEIRYVSPRMAEAYADLSMKTIRRDLRHLGNMGLLTGDPSGYRPNVEVLRPFILSRRTD